MMKKIFSAVCFLVFSWSAFAAQWPQKSITSVMSLRFPSTPQATTLPSQVNYLYHTDSCSYQAQVKPYLDRGRVHDSLTLAAFYEGMSKGIIKATQGKVRRKEHIKIADLEGLDIEYEKNNEESLPVTVSARALLVNGDVVVYSFTAPSAGYGNFKSLSEAFFASVSFHKDSVLVQYYPQTAEDTVTRARDIMALKADTVSKAVATAPVSFMDSHTGAIVRLFGLLILLSAVIYFLATLSQRKG